MFTIDQRVYTNFSASFELCIHSENKVKTKEMQMMVWDSTHQRHANIHRTFRKRKRKPHWGESEECEVVDTPYEYGAMVDFKKYTL